MTAAIMLCDLDDTLFSTLRKCPADVPQAALTLSAWGQDGAPISFATPALRLLADWLAETALLVPVTARSTEALLRTRIGFDHAVSAHGGVVLARDVDGKATPVPAWRERMETTLHPAAATLAAMLAEVMADAASLGEAIRARIIEEDGLALYLVVKSADPASDDGRLHRACAPMLARLPPGWTAHVNGNNVACLPPGLGKAHAVAWLLPQLRELYPDRPAIGVGDSHTDAGFMALCDFAMLPTHSQLGRRLFAA
jgi:hypothetical protein